MQRMKSKRREPCTYWWFSLQIEFNKSDKTHQESIPHARPSDRSCQRAAWQPLAGTKRRWLPYGFLLHLKLCVCVCVRVSDLFTISRSRMRGVCFLPPLVSQPPLHTHTHFQQGDSAMCRFAKALSMMSLAKRYKCSEKHKRMCAEAILPVSA